MKYKVVPFHPTVTDKGGADQAAKELEQIIETHVNSGWKFVSLQSMVSTVKPTGCNGIFAKSETATTQLVIFEQ